MKTNTNWGPFDYDATFARANGVAEVLEENGMNAEEVKGFMGVVEEGVLSRCFRAAGSKVQKALVEGGFLGKDANDKVLPRKETVFSDESVAAFTRAMNEALKADGITVEVKGKYEPGDAAQSRKRAEAMLQTILAKSEQEQEMFSLAFLGGAKPTVETVHAAFFKTEKKGKATAA
jgi:hypothetical protein